MIEEKNARKNPIFPRQKRRISNWGTVRGHLLQTINDGKRDKAFVGLVDGAKTGEYQSNDNAARLEAERIVNELEAIR